MQHPIFAAPNAGLKAGGMGLPCPVLSNIRSTSPINFFFMLLWA